jgi:hypothetical protein
MSVVIIGGNDRMHSEYKKVCKSNNCKVKIFTQMASDLRDRIGNPDLLILFTSTVSHKMVHTAVQEAQKHNINIERCHSSSTAALKKIFDKYK